MAIRCMDGFDHYGRIGIDDISVPLTKTYNSVGGTWYSQTGRYYGQSAYTANSKDSSFLKKTISSSGVTHFIIGFNIKLNLAGGYGVFEVSNNTVSTTKGLYIYRSGSNVVFQLNNTVISTVNYSTVNNIWKHYEIYMPLTPTGGDPAKFYIDGILIGTSTASMLYDGTFTFYSIGNSGTDYSIDDLYIFDNTGSTNNARIGTELYIPRIETQFPVDDTTNDFTASYTPITSATYGFQDLSTSTPFIAGISNSLSSNLAFSNVSLTGTDNLHIKINANGGVSDSKCLLFRTYQNGVIPSVTFATIASTLSFWYKDTTTADSTTLSVTVNGTQTFLALTTSMQQYTITLDANKVNIVKINASTNTDRYILLDDFTVTYTSKNAAQALYKVPATSDYLQSTTNGNKLIGNIGNLDTINDVKAVGFIPLASESVSAVTSSYKLIANNGGSDTEIGTTQSVTGVTTARSTQLFDINPLTSAVWTAADFNALKAGVINKT